MTTVRVTLLDTHTHAGVAYGAGDTLDLPTDSAYWLIDLGRAEPEHTDTSPIGGIEKS